MGGGRHREPGRQVRLQRLLRRGVHAARGAGRRRSPTSTASAPTTAAASTSSTTAAGSKWTWAAATCAPTAPGRSRPRRTSPWPRTAAWCTSWRRIARFRQDGTALPDVTLPPATVRARPRRRPLGRALPEHHSRIVRLSAAGAEVDGIPVFASGEGLAVDDFLSRQPASTGRPPSRAWFRSTPRT